MMKRILGITLAVIMLVGTICLSANAASGVAGNYYYTDIKTYTRGELMNSYNVGGKTVIVAEDLRNYGFSVVWDGNARTLKITDVKGAVKSNATESATGAIGAVAGSYYHTDIVTYFNDTVIESYNLNGSTVIPATILRDFGYVVNWDGDNRKVYIDPENKGGTDFANIKVKASQVHHGKLSLIKESVHFNGQKLVTGTDFYIETGLDKICFVPVKPILENLGIEYKWNSETSTLTVTVPEDKNISPKKTEMRSNTKKYGSLEYDIKDIEFNVVKGDKNYKVDAVIYGTTVLADIKDLAEALGFYTSGTTDIYTATMMYMIYSGMVGY